MDNNIVFSVIIPHKNCPDLLCRCINSIPNRDDVEIIVVDDNSSQEIVDFKNFPGIARKNLKIIFDKSNKGAGRARNIGIGEARGHWLLFADADDFFFEDKIEKILSRYQSESCLDVVYLNALSYVGNSNDLSKIQPRINRIFEHKAHLKDEQFYDYIRFETWEPWTRMCKRDFVLSNNIEFDEIPRQNDISFGLKVSALAEKWAFEESKVYCWVEWPKSLSHQKNNWDSFYDMLIIKNSINQIYRRKHLKRRECFLYYVFLSFRFLGAKATVIKTIPYIIKNGINPFSGLFYFAQNRFRL